MTLTIQYKDLPGKLITETFEKDEPEFFIGRRNAEYEPRINITWDRSVSRPVHARIFYDLGTWYIEHLVERNTTRLDNVSLPVGVPVELPGEAALLIGQMPMAINHDDRDAIPDGVIAERSAPSAPLPEVSEGQRFDVLSEVTQVLSRPGDDQLDRLLDVIRPHFPAMQSGGIALYRDKELFNPAYYPPGKATISNKLARRALEDRYAFRWDRKIATEISAEYTSLVGTSQALYAPIIRGVTRLGVLYLHTDSFFSDTDLSLLTAISEIIGANENFDPQTAHLRLPSVFVSYSHENTAFVEKLVADLRRQRVTVWYDERLRGSKEWETQLARAIQQANAFAVVLSPASLASKYVQWEIEQARAAGKPIFPLLHQDCDIPPDLSAIQYIDLLDNYRSGVWELAEDLYELSGEEDKLDSDLDAKTQRSPDKREKTRILFLAANPRDTDSLRLGEEIRTIQERIRGGKYRDQFDMIQQGWAVRYSDLEQLLLEHEPHIIHFSGHGSRDGSLALEDNNGNTEELSKETLRLLFKALNDGNDGTNRVRCVILNACFSAEQAEAIAGEVDCVVGMTRAVSDVGAIEFSASFYRALTYGKSVQAAFNLAGAAMNRTGEMETPHLLALTINPNTLVFCEEE